ncbi:MAG: DoxX family membrane protein [Actinomycetaceae bacterium]|nr:DoxX family membrane protein [Actinomycetaceae bacterium]
MSLSNAIARPLLACPFVVEGVDALIRPAAHRERAQALAPLARRAGIELDDDTSDLASRALGATYVVAGLSLAVGKMPRLAAATLAAAQVPVTLANNPAWQHTGAERAADLRGLASAGAVIGGLLLAATHRGGKPSFSWQVAAERKRRRAVAEARKKARAASSATVAAAKAHGSSTTAGPWRRRA